MPAEGESATCGLGWTTTVGELKPAETFIALEERWRGGARPPLHHRTSEMSIAQVLLPVISLVIISLPFVGSSALHTQKNFVWACWQSLQSTRSSSLSLPWRS